MFPLTYTWADDVSFRASSPETTLTIRGVAHLLEEIMKHPEYSDITPDEIRAILEECGCIDK